jgi:large conductance mechanosensitive channel
MPVVGVLLPGEQGYLGWKIMVGAKEVPYGLFIGETATAPSLARGPRLDPIGEVVNFLIIALALYLFIVKFLGWAMRTKKEEAAAPAAPAPSKEEQLLTEIRDLLKTQRG